MRIAISGMFWPQPYVGSGQYLRNLLLHLAAQPTSHRFILVIPRYRHLAVLSVKPSLPHIQSVIMPTPFDRRAPNLAKLWFEQVALNQVCRKLRADVLHVPYLGAPRYTRLPTIVTIHDLIPLLFPEYRGSRAVQLYMQLAIKSARRTAAIITDSQHTRQEVIDQLGIAPNRVNAIHLAAAPTFQPQPAEAIEAVRERFGIVDPYIYYIGGFDMRKNVATAIKAFARARRISDRRLLFVIAGRLPASNSMLFPDINRVILEEKVAADVVLLGSVSETENAALMSGCMAFVYPSRYEGFGLPPLEAMCCGAPTLASSTTSVGEVVGDGGIQLPPDDVDGWARAIYRVLNDLAWREELCTRGLQRARAFSWQTTAQRTLAIYEQCGKIR